jgi:hypothetical protein
VICDTDGAIVVAIPQVEVEFTPDVAGKQQGVARVTSEKWMGSITPLKVNRIECRDSHSYLGIGGSAGVRLEGVQDGKEVTWNIDGFADDEIMNQASGVSMGVHPEEEEPEP